ncbi:MAG: protein translocase subunit SecD [Actinomycetales bacterium]|nr:MAG: protein translocase subunit SecD [Actinomycetales bacterium]
MVDQPLFACDREGSAKYLLGPLLIKGTNVTNAAAGMPQNQVSWVVTLSFDDVGTDAFYKATKHLAGKPQPTNQFAIVLDSKVVSAPAPTGPIAGGNAEISGNFTVKSATSLANVLKYGALPLAFDISQVETVSATLGSEQLYGGLVAGVIGLVLVIVYAFFYYRALGLVVVGSLVAAATTTYATMVLLGESMGFALNLPGIAGVIVAIGLTADSFIIYFERIRDEVREGRTLRTAIETGWKRARSTIVIADMVSVLSATVLFILAIGGVKGFAFTLGLTTLIDLAVVFWFTKPLMSLLGRTKFFGEGHKLSGLDPEHMGVSRTSLLGRRSRASQLKAKEA